MTTAMNGYPHICNAHDSIKGMAKLIELYIKNFNRTQFEDIPRAIEVMKDAAEEILKAVDTATSMGCKMESALSDRKQTISELEHQIGQLENEIHDRQSQFQEQGCAPNAA